MKGRIKGGAGRSSDLPRQNQNVVVQEVFDELLVYDLKRNTVRRLNRTAAAIWRQCDGCRDVDEIARAAALEIREQVDRELVLTALRRFEKAHLLDGAAPESAVKPRLSRRHWIKRLGMAALPVVTSMAVPTSAQAQSCLNPGQQCSSNSQCCSGTCLPNELGIGFCV